MKYLQGEEKKEAIKYFKRASEIALNSTCYRARCGSVIIKNGEIIGEGYNSPPGNIKLEECLRDSLPEEFISDKTCCIHAEDRAIRDALVRFPNDLLNSTIYFTRINENREIVTSGEPYCTWCSKTSLDVGILEFVLWHEEGIAVYDTKEYNELSFKYNQQ